MPAPVILGVNCIVVLPTNFLVGVDVVQVANPAAPPHRRYTILCVVWFVGDALPRPLISIRAWTVPELNHTAQTIANISRRANPARCSSCKTGFNFMLDASQRAKASDDCQSGCARYDRRAATHYDPEYR